MAAAPTQMTPQQMFQRNMDARNLVLAAGVPMFQSIFAQSINPTNQTVVNIPIRNIGLIRGFLVKITGTLKNTDGAGATATRTPFGVANLISQFVFTDLFNTVRIQTTGWHMALINSAKQPLVFGGAYAPNVPMGYGNNWDVDVGPATIADTVDAPVSMYYYVPLAYTANDLRGSMYAGVVNATSQLQVTINPNPIVDTGVDATNAVYSGATVVAGTGGWKAASTVSIEVFQDYIDQIPIIDGNPILPQQDLSTIYELKNVALNGLVSGQDFGIPYANFRTFLSTTVVVDNNGTLNNGDEINYWALRAANTTELFRYGPNEAALLGGRNIFGTDLPLGTYHFSHRNRPINTQQFGNMNLYINPNSSINAAAVLLVGFEDFAMLDQVTYAGSLPTSG